MKRPLLLAFIALIFPGACLADDPFVNSVLSRRIIDEKLPQDEVKAFVESRLPTMPNVSSERQWRAQAEQLRNRLLDTVVFRGEAILWRDADLKVEWLETIAGGPEYEIQKLRYEVVPGMWVPALLYRPVKLTGRVPVVMNVNGHDPQGKAADYKQIRCINQAKRGMIALNVEWIGLGQLATNGFNHYRMNQLDLCGTSGLAPFYLAMSRGLDILLALPNADKDRVAVAGLSGGGWQTIFISALDTRVTLANPVAGYSSFFTRLKHSKDLGDSEQTPTDMATVADYCHLTAMLAPRPALLTYNATDSCCFESGYALPPLLEAALPVYKLFGKGTNLKQHTNVDPGNHNFGKDNRQALYRMFARHFSSDPNSPLPVGEIECQDELKSKQELAVDLPKENLDFHTLALDVMTRIKHPVLPHAGAEFGPWQTKLRGQLIQTVKADPEYRITAKKMAEESGENRKAVFWQLRIGDQWTIPAVEITPDGARSTTIVIADGGRAAAADQIAKLVTSGTRVVALDPFYFGESKIQGRDFLYALLVATVGQRPLGIQASQVAAVGRWLHDERGFDSVTLASFGPRTGLIALVAAALERQSLTRLELTGAYGSLRQIIEDNGAVNTTPELFCFGLLGQMDMKHIAMLSVPRKVRFQNATPRVRQEMADLQTVYRRAGSDFDPLSTKQQE